MGTLLNNAVLSIRRVPVWIPKESDDELVIGLLPLTPFFKRCVLLGIPISCIILLTRISMVGNTCSPNL